MLEVLDKLQESIESVQKHFHQDEQNKIHHLN